MDLPVSAPALNTDLDAPALADWRALVNKVLDRSGSLDSAGLDRAFARRLTTTTADGVTLSPLYTHADEAPERATPGSAPFTRGSTAAGSVIAGWDVRALHADADANATQAAVLADLEGGATSLWLKLGANAIAISDLPTILEPVLLDLAAVVLDAGDDAIAAAHALEDIWSARGLEPHQVSGNFGFDPLGQAARNGTSPDLIPTVGFAVASAERFAHMRSFVADGLVLHEAGATDAQELAGVIAMGTEYVRALVDAGLSVDLAFTQVEFRLSATADQFATIAKLRAARQLWSRVAEVSGVQQDAVAGAGAMRQHVVTSWSMLSRRDPWVNLLRGTVAAFGAGVGGAQSVTVLPFDAALGLPDSMSRRLARNTSALLIEESHVGRVIDPAGGSWFVENLTQEVAEAAWGLFTAMEGRGGFTADLASGDLASSLAQSARERAVRIAHRRDPLTGVSEFPDVHETPLVRKAVSAPEPRGFPRVRYAEGFERLRDRSDAAPEHPRVVLVAIGEVSDYTARTTFAKNFYEAGGIRAETIAFADSARAEITATGLACICSSDAVYADQAVAVAQTLTEWGIKQVHLAGPGGDLKDALTQAGVSVFVSLGVDVIDVLTTALNECGVAQ
ncbi:MAG: methylmalonyl-CoA mutase [Actinobacteria bacterium]|uniref:Unannotated protein n=1 Tax=freshwater metagenome TaxID=449393 RepID=A0A6J6VJX2_9ZZZZ|nr:methylmalonyl-CoA mutase [Actinomycetota bacterium]